MLRIQQLEVSRGQGPRAFRVQLPALALEAGQIVAVTGVSGCGKSTLLETLGLLLKPKQVKAFRLGRQAMDIKALYADGRESELAQWRARNLGFVLQNGGLLPYLSVWENMVLPRRLLGMPIKADHLDAAIATLKLGRLLNLYPSALSIGERQRVAFSRAIAHAPGLVLADEPTAALDPETAHDVFQLFFSLARELDLAVLLVSHDWDSLSQFAIPRLQARLEPGLSVFLPQGDATCC
ncbi:ABC transporter ATP-binding protein [Alcaligenes sp. SJTW-7]|uniref:ABC transporter ATP-binding protein n=1 Tax=Alcaligenes sp. SJTW-7 TaxID=3078429 RepID=UPI0039EBD542